MALPIIVIHNVDGSNTQASGAGPGDGFTSGSALFGSDGGSTSGTRFAFWDGDSLDLTNVATDGSHLLYIPSSSTRRFTRILGKKNTTQTFTANTTAGSATITNVSNLSGISVGDYIETRAMSLSGEIVSIDAGAGTITLPFSAPFDSTGSTFKCPKQVTCEESFNLASAYAIGGKRKDFETTNTHTKTMFNANNWKAGWIAYLYYTGVDYGQLTGVISLAVSGDTTSGRCKLVGISGTPFITCATNAGNIIQLPGTDYWDFVNIGFSHTHTNRGFAIQNATSQSTDIRIIDCVFDGVSVPLATGSSWTRVLLKGCEIKNCTHTTTALLNMAGAIVDVIGCSIHNNANPWVLQTASAAAVTYTFKDNLVYDNVGGGVAQTGTSPAAFNFKVLGNTFIGNGGPLVSYANTTLAAGAVCILQNNLVYGNRGYGVSVASISNTALQKLLFPLNRHNAWGQNSSGAYLNIPAGTNDKTLTDIPVTEASLTTYSTAIVALSPVAYFKFDESSGTEMTDSSGNARHGTYVNSPTFSQTGARNMTGDTSVFFDGVSDYATWTINGVGTGSFSFVGFIKFVSSADWSMLMQAAGASGFYLQRNGGTSNLYVQCYTGGVARTLSGSNNLLDGNWHHVAVVYDGTRVYCYRDGTLFESIAATGVTILSNGTTAYFATNSGLTQPASMHWDETAFFNFALTATQVNTLFRNSRRWVDFNLNDNASGGALCKGERYPKTFPGGLTVSSGNIGAV